MASWGTVVVQYPGVVFLGGTQTQDVTFVGYSSKPSGVYFEVPIPQTVYSAKTVSDYGLGYVGSIETMLALPGVVGGEWTQTPTPAGELTSNLVVYVQSDSGNSQGSIAVPFGDLEVPAWNDKIAALRTELNAAEAI
jgi:hypothetical protein